MADVEKIVVEDRRNGDGIGVGEMLALMQGNKGMDPAQLMAMMGNKGGGFGGEGGGMMWIFLLLLFGLGGNGGGLFGGNKNAETAAVANNDYNTQLLMQALNGNKEAITALSTNLNCDMGRVTDALCSIKGGIDKVAGDVNFTSAQVINAVQAGNCSIMSKVQECCCTLQTAILNQTNVMQQGFSSVNASMASGFANTAFAAERNTDRIIQNQTANTASILKQMCDDKIGALLTENATLKGQVSQTQQTLELKAYIDKKCGSCC